jgi:Na+-driven multidrug efflux pump
LRCFCNIIGDLTLVAGFDMGTKGADIATVAAQLIKES